MPCLASFPGADVNTITWTPNTIEPLPYGGFQAGDKVCRVGNPITGTLVHVCTQAARYHYAYVLWSKAQRRGDAVFDTHSHVYLHTLRHATPENVAAAEAVVAQRIYRQQQRYNLLHPRD